MRIEKVASPTDRLNQAFSASGLTQMDLVEETGIDKSSISLYLSGKVTPKSDKLCMLAKVLDVDSEWLAGFDVPTKQMDTFGSRLNKALEIRHMSAADLSKRTGIEQGTISSYRSGRYKPKQERIFELAECLDVSVSYLMGITDEIERYGSPEKRYSKELPENAFILDERERFIIETYRNAAVCQKMKIDGLVAEIAEEIADN